jgi:hypothetical protein
VKAVNKSFATLAAALTSVTGVALAPIGMVDITPPHVIEVRSSCTDLSILRVRFDKPVDQTTCEDSFNYMLGGAVIIRVTLLPDQQTAELLLDSPLTPNVTYELALNDIRDLTDNVLQPNPTRLTFKAGAGPILSITRDKDYADIAWPASFTGFTLQQSLTPGTSGWSDVTNAIIVVGSDNHVRISPLEGNRFFRLFHPCLVQ